VAISDRSNSRIVWTKFDGEHAPLVLVLLVLPLPPLPLPLQLVLVLPLPLLVLLPPPPLTSPLPRLRHLRRRLADHLAAGHVAPVQPRRAQRQEGRYGCRGAVARCALLLRSLLRSLQQWLPLRFMLCFLLLIMLFLEHNRHRLQQPKQRLCRDLRLEERRALRA